MTTTIGLLGMQHQDVLARLAAIEADLARATPDLAAFAAYLRGDVMQHFTLEEEALFPALERHLEITEGPLMVMNAEHAAFRELLDALGAAVAAADRDAERTHTIEIISLLRAHIHKEDHVLFPLAQQILTAEELTEVERRAAALEETAGAPR